MAVHPLDVPLIQVQDHANNRCPRHTQKRYIAPREALHRRCGGGDFCAACAVEAHDEHVA